MYPTYIWLFVTNEDNVFVVRSALFGCGIFVRVLMNYINIYN